MFERLKNLWKLSEAEISVAGDGQRAILDFPKSDTTLERKVPKGMAKVVDISNPIEQDFPEANDL